VKARGAIGQFVSVSAQPSYTSTPVETYGSSTRRKGQTSTNSLHRSAESPCSGSATPTGRSDACLSCQWPVHAQSMIRAGIVGASGYAGLELTRLLARHGEVRLVFATSDRWQGQPVEAFNPLTYVGNADGLAQAVDCDVVFFATPAETSLEQIPRVPQGVKVVDLAGTFRLRDAANYPRFYNFSHHAPELLAAAVYGLPELFRAQVKTATLVANPGCYATAAALSLAPLLKRGLIRTDGIVINGASGVSGAGRKATEDYSFMEIDGDVRTYKVLKHQHTPEIAQTLSAVAGKSVQLVFTPHLLPLKRGILNTSVAVLAPGTGSAHVQQAFAEDYAAEPLLRLFPSAEGVRLSNVTNTPKCHVGASCDGTHVVVCTALDNLLKGAASQAVQNMNLLFNQPETRGLG
jgi:N-acetyl-gamma-glutamyl-phosphate reductase